MSQSNYRALIQNLDAFIRKYSINKALKGSLYWLSSVIIVYLAFSLLENYFWFSSSVRKGMFYSFIIFGLCSLYYWVLNPLLPILRLRKTISHEQAAQIIGRHFKDVKDKLLNILQLKKQSESEGNALLLASVEQKTEDIKLIRFPEAINLGENKKYLKYAFPPFILLAVIFLAKPILLTKSTARILQNNQEFEKPALFTFKVDQDALKAVQYEDIALDISVDGQVLPDEAYITFGKYKYKLRKEGIGKFSYEFKNIQNSQEFRITSGDVTSRAYKIDVIEKPSIESHRIHLDYPEYTGKLDEGVENLTDIIIPIGTKVSVDLHTIHTDKVTAKALNGKDIKINKGDAHFSASEQLLSNAQWTFYIHGNSLTYVDSLMYRLLIIPDKFPQIKVELFQDSTVENAFLFFVGEASDDYGIKNILFRYKVTHVDGTHEETKSIPVKFNDRLSTSYSFEWDPTAVKLEPGAQLSYYFEVYDNDAINGSKTSRTAIMTLTQPSMEEVEKQVEKNDQAIMDQLQKSAREAEQLEKELEKLKNKLLTKEDINWQDKKKLEELLKKKQEMLEELKQAREKFEQNKQNQDEMSEEHREKQEKLEEMFKKVEKETEIEKLMKKIQELLQEMNKEEAIESLEKMEKQEEQQELDLERLEELYKKLELESEVQKQMGKLDKLAEEQEKLAKETEKQEKPNEELLKKQEEINKKFEEIKKGIEKIEDKNQKLTRPQDLGNPEMKMHNINDDLQKGTEELQKNNNQKAAQKQKDAAEKMKKMQEEMSAGMQGSQQEQMQEDMKMLRQLLENLVTISFEQEDLLTKVQNTDRFSVQYVENVQHQFKLQDDFTIVEDSLRALSKRVFQLEAFIMEKVTDINSEFDKTLDQLEERNVSLARVSQQKIMTYVNDLALMLSETLENMQMQMAESMPGNQMCNKPGMGKKPKPGQNQPGMTPMDKITEGQKMLSEEMRQRAKENQEKGKKSGGEGGLSSEEFAKMAKQQSQMRKLLENYQGELREQGKGSQALEEILKKMNDAEKQLVNKQLTNEMLKRQEEILTRLLESDRAERKRKMDQKREAETARTQERKQMPQALEEYLKKRKTEIEGLRSVSPLLMPFYKDLVDDYYHSYGTK